MPLANVYPSWRARLLCIALIAWASQYWVYAQAVFNGESISPDEHTILRIQRPDKTGITFRNDIDEFGAISPIDNLYHYGGSGVGLGDMDGDTLLDIVLCSNQNSCSLYRNEGDLSFKDIGVEVGFAPKGKWITGVTLADINGDGHLDIYVCTGMFDAVENYPNQCFINNGSGYFTERAGELGLDYNGQSRQGYFFDYDLDGDLDMYLVNGPVETNTTNFQVAKSTFITEKNHNDFDDKLYENVNGVFIDVTEKMGITDLHGFGLSTIIHDFNHDNYPDIFVANDFYASDKLWINKAGESFEDQTSEWFDKQTLYSMGSELMDLNQDLTFDILVADMAPSTMYRMKTRKPYLSWQWNEAFEEIFGVEQVSSNAAYLAKDDHFYNVADALDLDKTDWTWSVISGCFSNNLLPEVFFTNGLKRALDDLDLVMQLTDPGYDNSPSSHKEIGIHTKPIQGKQDTLLPYRSPSDTTSTTLLPPSTINNPPVIDDANFAHDQLVSSRLDTTPNLSFKATHGGPFQKINLFDSPYVNTQGAAIGDLDNDGDLDVVWNNTDTFSFLFENMASSAGNHFLRIQASMKENTYCIGCSGVIYYDGKSSRQLINPIKGYLSTSEPVAHFGLGSSVTSIDSLVWLWSDGTSTQLYNLSVDTTLFLAKEVEKSGRYTVQEDNPTPVRFEPSQQNGLNFIHTEDAFIEQAVYRLNPFKLSLRNPNLLVHDLDSDGFEDIVLLNSSNQKSQVFWQNPNGTFTTTFLDGSMRDEHRGVAAVDVNGDGLFELLFVSGGNHSKQVNDFPIRFYTQSTDRHYTLCDSCTMDLPFQPYESVTNIDDAASSKLLLGAGHHPMGYGQHQPSYVIEWGKDKWSISAGKDLGIVHELITLDSNSTLSLGEWGDISTLVVNEESKDNATVAIESTPRGLGMGLWSAYAKLSSHNSEMEIFGNWGLNSMLKADQKRPVSLRHYTWSQSPMLPKIPIVRHFIDDHEGYMVSRGEFVSAIPAMNRVYPTHDLFAKGRYSDLREYLDPESIQLNTLETTFVQDNEAFIGPWEMQLGPIKSITNLDDSTAIVFYGSQEQYYTSGDITFVPQLIRLDGQEITTYDVPELNHITFPEDSELITIHGQAHLLVTENNGPLRLFRVVFNN